MGAARESDKCVRYLASVATQHYFIEMLNRKPKCLHISCHGVQNNKDSMGINHAGLQKEGDFLLLETETFEGELVS
jgi:hypothetical protein